MARFKPRVKDIGLFRGNGVDDIPQRPVADGVKGVASREMLKKTESIGTHTLGLIQLGSPLHATYRDMLATATEDDFVRFHAI